MKKIKNYLERKWPCLFIGHVYALQDNMQLKQCLNPGCGKLKVMTGEPLYD